MYRSQSPLIISVVAIYSISLACFLIRHAIAPIAKVNKKLDEEREESLSPPQFSSIHPCGGFDNHGNILELFVPNYALQVNTIFRLYLVSI